MNGQFDYQKMAQEMQNYLNEGMKGINTMFDQEKLAQNIFNMAKDYATTTMQVMKTSNEQWEKTLDTMVKQNIVAQEEGQKMLADWTNRMKQGQQQYWNLMDENLKKMESYFNINGQKRTTK